MTQQEMLRHQVKSFIEAKIKSLEGETNDAVICYKLERIFAYREMGEVLTDTRIQIDGDRIIFED